MNNHINYIEFKAHDLDLIKSFYTATFGWNFTDYGPSYTAFENSGIEGGFELTDDPIVNGALVVLHHIDLEDAQRNVEQNGGIISTQPFSFPGGKRFHFKDPTGNELAIWCETKADS